MGLSSEESDDRVEERYEELCLDLNMDKKAKDDAWKNFEKIKKNYSLEVRNINNLRPFSLISYFLVFE